jgi:hypothetical protein
VETVEPSNAAASIAGNASSSGTTPVIWPSSRVHATSVTNITRNASGSVRRIGSTVTSDERNARPLVANYPPPSSGGASVGSPAPASVPALPPAPATAFTVPVICGWTSHRNGYAPSASAGSSADPVPGPLISSVAAICVAYESSS